MGICMFCGVTLHKRSFYPFMYSDDIPVVLWQVYVQSLTRSNSDALINGQKEASKVVRCRLPLKVYLSLLESVDFISLK